MARDFYSIFNGCADKDIGVETMRRHKLPSTTPIYKDISIDGREGTLTEFEGFEDIQIEVEYNFYTLKNINDVWRRVQAWLLNVTDNKLIFTDDPEMFYKVKKVILPKDIERTKRIGRFKATFVCKPFVYFANGLYEFDLNLNDNYLYNPGTYESRPIYKLLGEGIFKIKVNENEEVVANVGQGIVIKTDIGISYKLNGGIGNNKLKGKYKNLYLKCGDNKIRINVEGRFDKMEIIPNWRSY